MEDRETGLYCEYEGIRNATRISTEKEENRATRPLTLRPFPLLITFGIT
jgi:hypothetical protein